ncbi:hypothetical protein LOK49_LG13G00975 [Camellia lanceoleosa]|uniref:Uncharacterized protein n=1 Tax=Camellia lanceoleosa TaxID=1840588 RepID=A0ACC0FL53_9ERIC|nr:hypothetical protein LOK49_LG13G00975 [Camellia lanceoleosa]
MPPEEVSSLTRKKRLNLADSGENVPYEDNPMSYDYDIVETDAITENHLHVLILGVAGAESFTLLLGGASRLKWMSVEQPIVMALRACLSALLLRKEIENEKLMLEHVHILEENSGLHVQNKKLSKEASYAKESPLLAVELKNLVVKAITRSGRGHPFPVDNQSYPASRGRGCGCGCGRVLIRHRSPSLPLNPTPNQHRQEEEEELVQNQLVPEEQESIMEEEVESVESLIESLQKEYLVALVMEAISNDTHLIERVRNLAEVDPAQREIFVSHFGR